MNSGRILIEGLGGIGGVVAGELYRAGFNPTLVTNNDKITSAINDSGIQVKTPESSFTVHPRAYTSTAQIHLDEPFDVIFLIMKATGVVAAARESMDVLKPDGCMVAFQNGIVEDALAQAVGKERIVSGIIGWGATMHAPGRYERTSPGRIHIGEMDAPFQDRTRWLARVLDSVSPVDLNRNMRGVLWSKLAINCIVTTLGGVTGLGLGRMLSQADIRKVFAGVYREVYDTSQALDIKLETIAANPKLLYLAQDANWISRQLKDLLLRFVGRKYGNLKSSTIQSLERGRKTEIDFLNGYVVQVAERAGLQVPLNKAVVRIIREIEEGRREMGPENMNQLLPLLD